ncbi:MAG: OmpA family protein [Rhodocyclaceae bacterium]|nr:OmpA family protein [Rhodocyclaceae bacterium]
MSASKRAFRIVPRLSLVLALVMGMGTLARAEVTVYDKAPSVEELQQKLLGGEKSGQKKFKTRAIVFGEAPEAAPSAAAAPAAAPAAAAPQPAAQAAPQPAAAAQPSQTLQVSENAIAFPIQFKVNSAQILPESIPFLQSIAGLLQKDPTVRLLIEGHTDISGNYQRNMALSRERAFAVMNFLIDRFGIDPMRLMPVGKGPMEPLPGLEPTDPKNRRVQFRIIG